MVYEAHKTKKTLSAYSQPLTYDNFCSAIEKLAREVGGQFSQQIRGFLALAFGSALQLFSVFLASS